MANKPSESVKAEAYEADAKVDEADETIVADEIESNVIGEIATADKVIVINKPAEAKEAEADEANEAEANEANPTKVDEANDVGAVKASAADEAHVTDETIASNNTTKANNANEVDKVDEDDKEDLAGEANDVNGANGANDPTTRQS